MPSMSMSASPSIESAIPSPSMSALSSQPPTMPSGLGPASRPRPPPELLPALHPAIQTSATATVTIFMEDMASLLRHGEAHRVADIDLVARAHHEAVRSGDERDAAGDDDPVARGRDERVRARDRLEQPDHHLFVELEPTGAHPHVVLDAGHVEVRVV